MTRKWLLTGLLVLTIIVTIALAAGMYIAADDGALVLHMGDTDYSDSPLAWLIAFPIVVIVCVVAAVVTFVAIGAGIVLTLLALALTLVLTVIALLLGLLPLFVFLAIPVLAVYGLVKLLQPRSAVV
jgi:hypothetical protein